MVDGIAFDEDTNETDVVQFGILKRDLEKFVRRGMLSVFAQFDQLVCNGLINSKHIFKGLKRPLYNDDSFTADEDVLIYTRRPNYDFEWRGGPQGQSVRIKAPGNSVFVILVNKNIRHADKFPEIYGWIDRWNWIQEDAYIPEAPINHESRYGQRIFTNNGG